MELFGPERCIPTGLQHGTVTVRQGEGLYEVTTFRVEEGYSDGRHPDRVSFVGEVEADLARRDFTINAMAYAPGEGLIDPFGGREDLLVHRLVRAVGDPVRRFAEDGLRILRLYRFGARGAACRRTRHRQGRHSGAGPAGLRLGRADLAGAVQAAGGPAARLLDAPRDPGTGAALAGYGGGSRPAMPPRWQWWTLCPPTLWSVWRPCWLPPAPGLRGRR